MIEKVLPSPGLLVTSTRPPWASAMWETIARPAYPIRGP